MTRFTVLGDPDFEEQFTQNWVDSDSWTRATLTTIATWIDRELAVDADIKGDPVPSLEGESVRRLILPVEAPLVAVVYQVRPADLQVLVMRLIFR